MSGIGGPSFSMVANGNITPYSIVKYDTVVGKCVLAAAGTDKLVGICQEGTRNPPNTTVYNDDGYAAIAGENIGIYGPGASDKVMLKLGGTVSVGSWITSDSAGLGVATTTNKDVVIAIALDSGVASDLIPVRVVGPFTLSA